MPSRVLAIDGDGVRGILPARMLAELEEMGGPIADQFDLIAGSGGGAVLALALSLRPERGQSRRNAVRALDTWTTRAHRLFPRPPFRHRITRAIGSGTPGGTRSMRAEVDAMFGEIPLGDARPEVLVATFDLDAGAPLLIRSSEFRGHTRPLMRDVALASMTLPTHFAPVAVELGTRTYRLTHGGLVANNPSLFAYAAALAQNPPSSVRLLSLGTGTQRPVSGRTAATRRSQNSGWPFTAAGIFNAHLEISSEANHQAMESLLAATGKRGGYWRIQPVLDGELPDPQPRGLMDPGMLAAMAEQAVDDKRSTLVEVAEALAA
ncbi:MAG: patatin-like phospholipase family protein [Acidimicrobiaceae bacterium]|nr:patatin-like phospholipase family protein [Acidimicrobiaceae bacterium]